MKVARFYGKLDIRVEEVDEPIPADGEVVVDVAFAGICGSDLHEYLIGPVMLPTPERPHPISGIHIPVILGHELCGTVRSPPPGSKLKDGDAVMVDPRVQCHSCRPCKAGHSHSCSRLGYVGATTAFGGFGEKVVVTEDKLHLLPPEIPLDYAAVLEPLAVVHHAMKEVNGTGTLMSNWQNRDILVLGGGPIGFALLLCLRAAGANNVIVSEPTARRRNQVAEFATAVIDPTQVKVEARCLELTAGRGVEVVFDCAGVPQALQAGVAALRYNGIYVMIALWEEPITVPCLPFLAKHVTMRGVFVFDDNALSEAIELVAEGKLVSGYCASPGSNAFELICGKVGIEKMITGRIGLDNIVSQGFEELVHNKDKHIKILVSPK